MVEIQARIVRWEKGRVRTQDLGIRNAVLRPLRYCPVEGFIIMCFVRSYIPFNLPPWTQLQTMSRGRGIEGTT